MLDANARRPTRGPVIALLVLVLVVAIVVVTVTVIAHHRRADRAQVPAVAAQTTPVRRQTLTNQLTVSGAVTFTGSDRLIGRGAGTITKLPVVGHFAARGDVLYRVDDQPVVVLYGNTPFFRTISSTRTTGADVAVLARNLSALGYFDGFIPDDPHEMSFTSLLRESLKNWQRAIGLTASGTFAVGQAVVLPREERVSAVSAALGDPAAEPVARMSSTHRVVTAGLSTDDQQQIPARGTATVTLPTGPAVRGRYAVAATPSSSPYASGPTPSPYQLTLTLANQNRLASAGKGAVRISILIEQHRNVLTVPIAALLALDGGHAYAVQLRDGRLIGVRTGMFTSDYVQVSGRGLTAGIRVVTAS